MKQTEKIEMTEIGKIVAPVGLRGEVKIYPYSENAERFAPGAELLVGGTPMSVETSRFVKNLPIIKFVGAESRDDAEALRGRSLFTDALMFAPLPEGEWYVRDLIGCDVSDEAGESLGTISDVRLNGAQDLYEIAMEDGRKFLLPAVEAFILHVDTASKRVIARVPDGLLELAL
jgi:16S rRNA processing protein RimM